MTAIWGRLALGLIVMLALLEFSLRKFSPDPPAPNLFNMSLSPATQNEPWFHDWQTDHEKLRREFRAYEIYGLRPFVGKHIQLDSNGYRRSWTKPDTSIRWALFGGSTLWGSLARDEHTIPSYLNRELSEFSGVGQSQNYGEVGFVFSQEVHRAVRLLYEQAPFQHAVFLDGVNDAMAALTNYARGIDSVGGLPWEAGKYGHLFALGKTGEITFQDIFNKSMVYRRVNRVLKSAGLKASPKSDKQFWRVPSTERFPHIAQQVGRSYARIAKTADGIFKGQGKQATFILQPLLLYKVHPTPAEQKLLDQNQYWIRFMSQAYRSIREEMKNTQMRFLDYSELFGSERGEMFSDVIHYTEAGNKKIAARLFKDLTAIEKNDAHKVVQAVP